VGACVVEVVPGDSVAPSGDDTGCGVCARGVFPLGFNLGVCGHYFEDLGWWERVFGVHVAPPEDRFDPAGQPHSPVVPQQLTQGRVGRAFDLVVHRRQRPLKLGVGVGEQHFGSDEPIHTVAGPHESFVRVLPPAIVPLGLLREEALPALAPVQVGVYP